MARPGGTAAYFVVSTSRFTNLDFKAGQGELHFPDPGDDPIARLEPLRVTAALFRTMDDFVFPETIRVLGPSSLARDPT